VAVAVGKQPKKRKYEAFKESQEEDKEESLKRE